MTAGRASVLHAGSERRASCPSVGDCTLFAVELPGGAILATDTAALNEAFSIRHRVFVEEQGIPAHLDRDGHDDRARQVLLRVEGDAAATGRVLIEPNGEAILARIAVLPAYRGSGLGGLVVTALHELAVRDGARTARLHPHRYLERFYRRLGYRRVEGDEIVAGHELITMVRELAISEE